MVYALWAKTIEGEFKMKDAKDFEEATQQKLRSSG